MGLESHIRQVVEDDPTVMAFGLDYWFENGLKTSTQEAANEIVRILNDSGEFGPSFTHVDPDGNGSDYVIEFNIHPQFRRK